MEKLKIQNLGKLPLGNTNIFVSLLPTGVKNILVKYSPEVLVSCIIPPKDFHIQYSSVKSYSSSKKHNLELASPALIMSCGYGDIPAARTHKAINSGYTLWALDTTRDDGIYVKPYKLANVWDQGKICFGDLTPNSLRQAFNYYWTSGFNDDIKIPHIFCLNKKHKYEFHSGCVCDESQKKHICDCSRKTFHNHYGCGCTTVAKSKNCKGSCKEKDCSCCKAIRTYQKKNKKNGMSDKKISKLAVIKLEHGKLYPGCNCSWRHKRHCSCAKTSCGCVCDCDCCNKHCEHGSCECKCCRNVCKCKCNCSKVEKLKQHLTTYHQTKLPLQKWKNRTAFFCGEKYWAAPEGAEGVLVSNDRRLLTAIPQQFWRRDRDGRPLVIALGHRQGIRGWEFRSGSYSFYLDHRNVVFK